MLHALDEVEEDRGHVDRRVDQRLLEQGELALDLGPRHLLLVRRLVQDHRDARDAGLQDPKAHEHRPRPDPLQHVAREEVQQNLAHVVGAEDRDLQVACAVALFELGVLRHHRVRQHVADGDAVRTHLLGLCERQVARRAAGLTRGC